MAQSLQGMDALFSNSLGLIWAAQPGREVSKPSPSCFGRKWVQPNSFWSQCNDGLEFFERISWVVSWKWDLRLDHSAQHPDSLSESLEWFWIYADVKRGESTPASQHEHTMRSYQLSSLYGGVLFPPISSVPHILQALLLYMKNRSFQMAPVVPSNLWWRWDSGCWRYRMKEKSSCKIATFCGLDALACKCLLS